jgi:DNA repair protein RadC
VETFKLYCFKKLIAIGYTPFFKKMQTLLNEITVSYRPNISSDKVTSVADAYKYLKPFYPDDLIYLQEMFVVMYLNNARNVIGIHKLSTGGMTATIADVRLVLGIGLKVAATGIILSHNHPSGNKQPSLQDEALTARIMEAGKLMEIKLLDHVILSSAEGEYFSFADEGLLWQ